MRLEQLEYLLAICECHSINLASQKLHVSQQSISKAIQNLEAELNTTLLERTAKGTTLTLHGKLVVNSAQKIFAEIDSLKHVISQPSSPVVSSLRGNIHIMYNNSIDYADLIFSSNEFSKAYPHCTFSFHQKPLQDLPKAIFAKKADLGLFVAPLEYPLNNIISKEGLQSLSIIPYSKDVLLVAVSKKTSLSKQKSLSLKTCLKYPIILVQHDSEEDEKNSWLVQLLNQHGTPNFIMRVNNQSYLSDLISANIGITFVAKRIIQLMPKSIFNDISIIPLRPAVHLYGNYIINNTVPLSPLLQAYLPYLLSKASAKIPPLT